MIVSSRHLPQWERRSPRAIALMTLRDAVLSERSVWPTGGEIHTALGRAERAIATAARLADHPKT